MAEKAKASDLVVGNDAVRHVVDTPFGELALWVKPLSWIERQNALTRFVTIKPNSDGDMAPSIDFGGFWEFVYSTCINRTDPDLTNTQLMNLKPEVGEAIQSLLPSFESLMQGLAGGATGPLV